MHHESMILHDGSKGRKYKFEFDGQKGEKHAMTFVIGEKTTPAAFLEDLAKALKEYMGRYEKG